MAMIGAHFIYKVEDVVRAAQAAGNPPTSPQVMFPVSNEDVFGPPLTDEAKYVNSFLVR